MTTINGTNAGETITGTAQDDLLQGAGGADTLYGGGGRDLLYGGAGDDVLTGNRGGDASLYGGDGADLLRAFWATPTSHDLVLDGGAGIDTAQLDLAQATSAVTLDLSRGTTGGVEVLGMTLRAIEAVSIASGSGDDRLIGGAYADRIDGGTGNDWIEGGAGDDRLDGGKGDDTLIGGAGVNVLNGGDGVDLAVIDRSKATADISVSVFTPGQLQTLDDGGSIGGVERLSIRTGAGADTLTGGAYDDTISAGGGDDVITGGGAGHDLLYGGAGADVITGNRGGGAELYGDAGDDRLNAFWASPDSHDRLVDGGAGADTAQLDFTQATDAVVLDISQGEPGGANVLGMTISSIERLVLAGGSGDDHVIGGALDDSIDGGAGADWLNGGVGDDTVAGGLANDVLIGGKGADSLAGGAGDDQLDGGAGDDRLSGGDGQDVLVSGVGVDTLDGGAGVDRAVVDRSGATADFAFSLADPNQPQQLQDGTRLVNVERIDFTSGSGADHITGGALADLIAGGAGNDVIHGGGGADELYGGAGDDIVYSDAEGGAAQLHGDGGGDLLIARYGDRLVDGGAGTDTAELFFNAAGQAVVLDLSHGSATGLEVLGTTLLSVEAVHVHASALNDQIVGGSFTDVLYGDAGDDWLDAGKGGLDVLDGGAGNDTLVGGAYGAAVLEGNAGIDLAIVDRGKATAGIHLDLSDPSALQVLDNRATLQDVERIDFTSGSGADTLTGGLFDDVIRGGAGDDNISGGDGGADKLFGGAGRDHLVGTRAGAELHGDAGDDTLWAYTGDKLIDGGAGSDHATLFFADASAAITLDVDQELARGADVLGAHIAAVEEIAIFTGQGADVLTGGALNDSFQAGGGDDRLDGGAGDDLLVGGEGDDLEFGGAGDDTIGTGLGHDVVDGGAGADTLILDGERGDYRVTALSGGAVQIADLRAGHDDVTVATKVETFELGGKAFSLAELLVAPADRPPEANPDSFAVKADAPTTLDVLANDRDPDGDPITLAGLRLTGTMGSVSLANGTVQYDAGEAFKALKAGEIATDHFGYLLKDGDGRTSEGAVTVTVTGVNDAPIIHDHALMVSAGSAGLATVSMLDNASDPEGDAVTIAAIDARDLHGSASYDPVTGEIHYSPGSAFAGLGVGETATDVLHVIAADADGALAHADLKVTVTGVNDAPVAVGDEAHVSSDQARTTMDVLANDLDPDHGDHLHLGAFDSHSAAGASVALVDGKLVYDAGALFASLAPGETTTDTFHYSVADDHGATGSAQATVLVTGAGAPPTECTIFADEDATVSDSFDTLQAISKDLFGAGAHLVGLDTSRLLGHATLDAAARVFTYTADDPSFEALFGDQHADSYLGVKVATSDGALHQWWAEMEVTGVDDPAVAGDDQVDLTGTGVSQNLWAQLLSNDHDPDGPSIPKIMSVDGTGANGTLHLDIMHRVLTFDPADNLFNGTPAGQPVTESFTYIYDAGSGTDVGHVTLTIHPEAGII